MTDEKDIETLLAKLAFDSTPVFPGVLDFLRADVPGSLSELRRDLYDHLRALSTRDIGHAQFVSFVENASSTLRASTRPEAAVILERVFEPLQWLNSGRYGVGWCDEHAHVTVLPCDQGSP